jgi:dTDP-glucose 4,6-dehydratase
MRRVLVTGGAGFIGSSFIRYGLQKVFGCERLVNLDALTYASNLDNLASVAADPRYRFVQGDIRDEALVKKICIDEGIDAIVHFAAESHVDRSIAGPHVFVETNVLGTQALLEVVRQCPSMHFHHISTDEVYGSLGAQGKFNEEAPYRPNSPYAASKAASDHLVRAYAHTYGIAHTLSHCTNNYGPCQHVEKLIPRVIECLIDNQPIPLYGRGDNVRDWVFVDDHSEAVWLILEKGKKGEVYDIGGECERSNLELVHHLMAQYAALGLETSSSITLVSDRPGHDFRYAIDCSKIKKELGWAPRHTLAEGLCKTILWYTEQRSYDSR